MLIMPSLFSVLIRLVLIWYLSFDLQSPGSGSKPDTWAPSTGAGGAAGSLPSSRMAGGTRSVAPNPRHGQASLARYLQATDIIVHTFGF